MRGKRIAVLSTVAALLMAAWQPVLATLTVAGGAALMSGCSAERSDTRQDARTETRTSERTEDRVEDRNK